MVGQLQREMKEAETVVQEESSSLQRVQVNADAAEQAAKQAQQQVNSTPDCVALHSMQARTMQRCNHKRFCTPAKFYVLRT